MRAARAIVFALLLVSVAATYGCSRDSDDGGQTPAESPAATMPNIDPVQDFRAFAGKLQGTPAGSALEPSALAEGLRALAGALGTVGLAPSELLVDLRVAAEHVLLNPDSPEVAATVRTALGSAAAALPESSRAPATQAAAAIDPAVPLTDQGAALSEAFKRIADAMPARTAGEE